MNVEHVLGFHIACLKIRTLEVVLVELRFDDVGEIGPRCHMFPIQMRMCMYMSSFGIRTHLFHKHYMISTNQKQSHQLNDAKSNNDRNEMLLFNS